MFALSWRRLASSSPVAVALLVAANAVPLLGVLFAGWDLMTIIRIYWLENGVVGVFAVLRILTAMNLPAGQAPVPAGAVRIPEVIAKVLLVPFFVLHYGLFWLGHGIFVWFALPAMLMPDQALPPDDLFALPDLGPLVLVGLALVISHGASFLFNWIGRGEYRTATPNGETSAPYGRVVVLHLTIIFGAMAVAILGAPVWALVVMVVLKTAADLQAHLAERERAAARASVGAAAIRADAGA